MPIWSISLISEKVKEKKKSRNWKRKRRVSLSFAPFFLSFVPNSFFFWHVGWWNIKKIKPAIVHQKRKKSSRRSTDSTLSYWPTHDYHWYTLGAHLYHDWRRKSLTDGSFSNNNGNYSDNNDSQRYCISYMKKYTSCIQCYILYIYCFKCILQFKQFGDGSRTPTSLQWHRSKHTIRMWRLAPRWPSSCKPYLSHIGRSTLVMIKWVKGQKSAKKERERNNLLPKASSAAKTPKTLPTSAGLTRVVSNERKAGWAKEARLPSAPAATNCLSSLTRPPIKSMWMTSKRHPILTNHRLNRILPVPEDHQRVQSGRTTAMTNNRVMHRMLT